MRYASELMRLFQQPSSSKCFSSFGFCFLSCITRTWVGFEKEVANQFLFTKKTESQVPVPTDSFKFLPAARLSHQPTSKSRLKLGLKAVQKTRKWFQAIQVPKLATVQAAGSLSPHFHQYLQCYPIIHPLSPYHWWLMMALNPYNSCTVGCWKPLWLPHLHWDHGNRGCPATGSRWQPRHHQQLSEYIWIIFPPIWGTPETLV